MAAGEGSWEGYLHIAAQAGILPGDVLEGLFSPELHDSQQLLVKNHLNHKASASFTLPGTGKEEATVETVRVLFLTGLARNCLIVSPAFKVSHYWPRLFKNAFEDDSLLCRVAKRQDLHSSGSKVFLVTYGRLSKTCWAELIAAQDWDIVIVDEAHNIRNTSSQRSQATYAIGDRTTKYKIALSCTPLVNHLYDAWGIFRFLQPEILGRSFQSFVAEYYDSKSARRLINKSKEKQLINRLRSIRGVCWSDYYAVGRCSYKKVEMKTT